MPLVGIPTMSAAEEAAWVERMKSGLGVLPSQARKPRPITSPVEHSTSVDAGSLRRKALSAVYRGELHESLPLELKKYLD